jgi:hypothetical protein
MKVTPLPPNEEERLAALQEYQILDTAAESVFEQKQSRKELLLRKMSGVLQACMAVDEAYVAISKFCGQLFPYAAPLDAAVLLTHKIARIPLNFCVNMLSVFKWIRTTLLYTVAHTHLLVVSN